MIPAYPRLPLRILVSIQDGLLPAGNERLLAWVPLLHWGDVAHDVQAELVLEQQELADLVDTLVVEQVVLEQNNNVRYGKFLNSRSVPAYPSQFPQKLPEVVEVVDDLVLGILRTQVDGVVLHVVLQQVRQHIGHPIVLFAKNNLGLVPAKLST